MFILFTLFSRTGRAVTMLSRSAAFLKARKLIGGCINILPVDSLLTFFLFCPGRWPCIELSQLFVFVSQLHACMFLFNFRNSAVSAASSLDSDRAVLFCFVLYLLFVPARRPPCSRASCICIGALSTVLVPCRGVSCPFRCCMGGR